jgi:hypothetical protein
MSVSLYLGNYHALHLPHTESIFSNGKSKPLVIRNSTADSTSNERSEHVTVPIIMEIGTQHITNKSPPTLLKDIPPAIYNPPRFQESLYVIFPLPC